MTQLLETFLAFIFLLLILAMGNLFIANWIERDVKKAVVISDTPEGCYEYEGNGEIFVECPEVTKTVGIGKKLDYYDNRMARSGHLKMNTWYMEEK